MTDFFEALFKFFTEFTWRKMLGVAVAGVGILVVLLIFERYTSSFRLSRLQKAAALLSALQDVQSHSTNEIPQLKRAREGLLLQAAEAIEEKPLSLALEFIPSKLAFSADGLWKFLAGGAAFWIFAIWQLVKPRTKESNAIALSLAIFGGISGLVAMYIQPIWWPWFHFLIYPWLFLIAVTTVSLPILIPNLTAAKRKAVEITCINNLKQVGLAARIWANEHGSKLPPPT